MRISDWSSDVCSSDLKVQKVIASADDPGQAGFLKTQSGQEFSTVLSRHGDDFRLDGGRNDYRPRPFLCGLVKNAGAMFIARSEEHTSELQSLMRISYAVFCLKKQKTKHNNTIKTSIYEHNNTLSVTWSV